MMSSTGKSSGEVSIFTAAEIVAQELVPVSWIVEDILPEGVTFLAGKPKMGKSWMGLDLGIALATGGVALGTKRVEQGDVLCLALEDNRRRIQNRLNKLLAGRSAPANLHITTEWPRLDKGGAELLDDWLAAHPDARLVIGDTLARLKPHASGRRTQYDEDREAVDPLGPIAAKHGVAILLVHHLRETESDDPLDMITGSVGLTGGVDGALVLKRKRGRADAYLTVEGRDIENPTELALRFDQGAATWAVMGDAEEYRRSETRRAILRVLEHSYEPLGPQDIADALGEKNNTVRQRLYQMSKDGEVKVVARGLYALHNIHNDHNEEDTQVTEVMGVMDSRYERGDTPPVTCIHNFLGGKGCYVCDPHHPYRKGGIS
jgi:AAA domain